jgi:hypothetical protein
MKNIAESNAISYHMPWLTLLVAMVYLWPTLATDTASAGTRSESQVIAAIRILDQHGRQVQSGKRDVGSQIFDVTVGPIGKEFNFAPDTVNIRVGDTCAGPGPAIPTVLPVARPASPMGNFVRPII